MSLAAKININAHYTRSINLERDVQSSAVVEAYIPTSRAVQTFERIALSLSLDESPRAWSLVGPYGSGKSSFAVFLTHLLGGKEKSSSQLAYRVLQDSELGSKLISPYQKLTENSEGYLTITLTGNSESLSRALLSALAEQTAAVWAKKNGPAPAVISEIQQAAESTETLSSRVIVKLIAKLQDNLSRIGYAGLFIVIDELGKFLEYEVRHNGTQDIYLLQEIAEHAQKQHAAKLGIVVLLHQAFEQYARSLGESLRNEWSKVQGRFESIPFLESAEQTLRIVSAAIKQNFSDQEMVHIANNSNEYVQILFSSQALPASLNKEDAVALFQACYPLHPISALVLPILCQKIAQNERTLFSYLGSKEQHGFQESFSRCAEVSDWIEPWEIYEYFILNQPAAISDHFTHRRWAEVVTAVERLGDAEVNDIKLLKTIGLLNIIGAQGGLKASKELISICLPTAEAVNHAIDKLINCSVIQYRKFNAEYRVWQGSDFNLDEHVHEERSKLGYFGLAEALNQRHALQPIVARRHTIENGALRYFVPYFTDAATYSQIKASNEARLIFFLAESKQDEEIFHQQAISHISALDIIVLCRQGDQFREKIAETLALEAVQKNAQALHTDPIAKREFSDRYAAAWSAEQRQTAYLLETPNLGEWYYQATLLNVRNKRDLQQALSNILAKVYKYSPRVANELINRDNPSSQANAAKNKLISAMLNHANKHGLGFEKFPPEKAIYLAVLKASKLHRKNNEGIWTFTAPDSTTYTEDPCNYYPVWQHIERFLHSTEKTPKSLVELNKELMSPPYGIKLGVLPILYVAVILANQEELAIYQNKVYKPSFTEEMAEHFLKRPDEFTFQHFKISGINASVFKEYSSALFADGELRGVLAIAKPLAKFLDALPEYTQKTGHLSKPAIAVREGFKLSKSPVNLLSQDIPKALGFDVKNSQNAEDSVAGLAEALREIVKELKYCFSHLKKEMLALCAQALHTDKSISLPELRKIASGRYHCLEQYTIDKDGLRAFILRLTQKKGSDEEWFDGLLTFLGQKPIEKWHDAERSIAEYRLAEFSHKLDDLEKLRIHFQTVEKHTPEDFDVYLLRSVKKGALDKDEVVAVTQAQHQAINQTRQQVTELLSGLGDKELALAALAEVVDGYLDHYRQASTNRQQNKSAKTVAKKLNKGAG